MLLRMKRRSIVSFLVSGNGILFSSIAKKIFQNDIKAEIGCVITENKQARVIQRASDLGVPCYYLDPAMYDREKHEENISQIMEACKTDLIVAAGYLRLLTPYFTNKYQYRIINIHPSLLPSFPGLESQRKAYEYGVRVTGCTTHFIDEGIDTGPIIMQSPVWISDTDTVESLSARILKEETRILSESVRLYCEGKIKVKGDSIRIIR
jgi:phosphoribosylglycinamide formyltransferase 1